MEVERKNDPSNTLANGNANSGKRGRGRPRGSVKKQIISVKEVTHNARASKRVDFFSPETVIRPKVKKRGRPKKIKIPGRPRKIPLTPEEEAERFLRLSKKRKFSKPLGRPRIHPLVNMPKEKRGRGRPRKYESVPSANGRAGITVNNGKAAEVGEDTPRGRGRPRGSFKKKRGRPPGSFLVKMPTLGSPRTRGRPPGSGSKLHIKQDVNGAPRKRGRPPGSGTKIELIAGETNRPPRKRGRPTGSGTKIELISHEINGTPRKRGRPPGSGLKVHIAQQDVDDGIPRKRGRPPGSGTKVKNLLQETNGSPRKRGRPPGSVKVKLIPEQTKRVLTNSAFSFDGQPRKRGRPKKAEALPDFQTEEVKSIENNEPSPKRPRNSFSSIRSLCKPHPDDRRIGENAGGRVENPVLSAGGAAKPGSRENVSENKLNNASVQEVHEGNSKKGSSSRAAGKPQKKK